MNVFEFITSLKQPGWELLGEGHQTKVYSHPDKDFVVKFPKFSVTDNPRGIDLLVNGYLEAHYHLEGLVPEFSIFKKIPRRFFEEPKTGELLYTTAIVQQRITPYEQSLDTLVKERKSPEVKRYVEDLIGLDREMLRRGIFVRNVMLKNYGTTNDGKVVLSDCGDVSREPDYNPQNLPKLAFANITQRLLFRGFTHYLRLQELASISPALKDEYMAYSGLNFSREIDVEITAAYTEAIKDKSPGKGQIFLHRLLLGVLVKYQEKFIELAKEEMKPYFDPKGMGKPSVPYITIPGLGPQILID